MYNITKRIIDIIGAIFGLVLLSPLLVVIAIWIKTDSKGPVFYVQKRAGKNLKYFSCIKFRTMTASSNQSDQAASKDQRYRITKVGAIIRPLRIDEIPQLVNVLIGQMSLVGPRPQIKQQIDLDPENFAKILSVKPGWTGVASILIYDIEDKILAEAEDGQDIYVKRLMPRKFRYNMLYVKHRSFALDMLILWWTFKKLILRRPAR